MADFRKISVLAAVALMLGLVSTASAQVGSGGAFTCVANAAVPPTVRAEGLTELVGDIVLDCTGGIPTPTTSNIPQVNFTVFLNTNITSRLYSSSNISEALLLVDEPGTTTNASPILICGTTGGGCTFPGTSTVAGIAGTGEPYNGTVGSTGVAARPNAFQGIVTGNQVQFIGVPVDAPGTSGHRIFRITNLRANASGISAGPSGTPGTLQALISASGSTSVPINNPTQVVGFVQNGMTFNLRTRSDFTASPNTTTNIQFAQCNSLSRTATTNSFILQYLENFPTAFKVKDSGATSQNVPGTIYNTESGFYSLTGFTASTGAGTTTAASPNIGLADTGTRLKAIFSNIPAGVSVYASTSNVLAGATSTPATGPAGSVVARLLTGPAGPVAFASPSSTDFTGITAGVVTNGTQLPVVNGTATATWEVIGANPLSSDSYYFAIWYSFSASPGTNSPAPGSSTVTGGFAPTPTDLGSTTATAATANQSLSIPRFIEGTQTRTDFSVFTCRTNLLFPFVTNQAGFDTGLAIANTSTDPFGTTAQAGSCTLFTYGANAPASIPTGNIASGTVYVTLASTAMPNFQGYMIANCQFQFAHGFAFISDFGARNLAMGYLALVIPEPGLGSRAANPLSSSTGGSGEQLAQ